MSVRAHTSNSWSPSSWCVPANRARTARRRMALLDRLLPAWRHRDPEMRAAAVRALGRDAQETLASVARTDGDVRIRRIAIKKVDDAEVLLEIGRNDADEELRAFATARAEELLVERATSPQPPEECSRALAALTRASQRVTVAVRAVHASVRREALSGVSEERAFAEIARRSKDSQIGLEALERVSDATLLCRIAAGAPRPEVAFAALGRIHDPGLLQSIADDPQVQKGVRKRARAMLELVLTDDHPLRIAQRRDRQLQLCVTVERLRDEPDQTAALATLRRAESDWRNLSMDAAAEPEVEERFRRACQATREAIARSAERDAKDQQRAAGRLRAYTARQQLCEAVEALEGPGTPEQLEAARSAWRALEPSDDSRCHELTSRFALAVERCEQRFARWQARDSFRAQLEALAVEAERLVEPGDPRAAARPRLALEARWARLESSPEGRKWLASERALQRRFVEAGEALRNQERTLHAERQQREREGRGQVKALCARLEQLAREDTFKYATAERAVAAAADALRRLPPLPAAERETLRQRLTEAQQKVRERVQAHAIAEDWKRWANADVQQQLIERAEALVAADDPRAMLREIGELEREWKRFPAAPRDHSQALWERFRSARNELRRRCGAYLAENLAKKEALCEAAEQLADSTDWNATTAAFQRMQAEWKRVGPVRQQVSAALFERFRAPANRFFERRAQFLLARKQRNEEVLGRMRALCEGAEALADSTDWEATAAEVKRLQADARRVWRRGREAVPPRIEPQRQADMLAQRFQAACDRFSDRYRRRDEVELEASLAAADSILADLAAVRESVTGADRATPQEVMLRLKDRLAAWRRVGPIPAERAGVLQQQLQAICDAVEAAHPDGLPEGELAAESNVPQREKLCIRLERVVTSLSAFAEEPAPGDLAERLKVALAAKTIGGPAVTRREQALREAAEQAERLREKWQRLGPVIGQRARALALRFDKAVADLDELRARVPPQPNAGS
jgi:phage host-nuclease inhibitor protein Gam